MSSVYVPPLLTTVPGEPYRVGGVRGRLCAFFSICAAGSLPTPLVPSSGSSPPHAVSAAVSPGQSATATRSGDGPRTAGAKAVTGGTASHLRVGGGRRQRTRAAYAARRSSPSGRPARARRAGRASLNSPSRQDRHMTRHEREEAHGMAAGAPRVFVSHLVRRAGLRPERRPGGPGPGPRGDAAGRAARRPRLLGLVVEVASRRRIFLPMTRVTGVESGQVITTGVVNMRRFEQRPTERLVLGELLDRRVTAGGDRRGGDRPGRVDPAAAGPPRLGDRQGLRAQGARRRAAARKGETLTVEWSAVTGFSLEEHGQGAESLLATFERLRPADLANVLHHLSPKRRARGRRRAGRRPARRRPGGAARGRPGRDPRQAQGGARGRRPGGDGPGRRGRPALRAARGGQGAAAGADAARTTRRTCGG